MWARRPARGEQPGSRRRSWSFGSGRDPLGLNASHRWKVAGQTFDSRDTEGVKSKITIRLRLTCTLRLIREGRRKRSKELREGGQEGEDLSVKEGGVLSLACVQCVQQLQLPASVHTVGAILLSERRRDTKSRVPMRDDSMGAPLVRFKHTRSPSACRNSTFL
ncbi:hypothetical protein EYF80_003759 [Liparis tanakae]|uniref:Uncharacterized protein n=1 Tax=Liparis tanakae TaxID=230148 RepID=A0A4Z2J6A1_9TELE|nr:hypothetical protein EYF80_003759 [Liparis tanakae]